MKKIFIVKKKAVVTLFFWYELIFLKLKIRVVPTTTVFILQHWPIVTFVFHGEIRGTRNYFLRSTSHIQVLRVKEELSIYTIFFFVFLNTIFQERLLLLMRDFVVFYTTSNCRGTFFSDLCHLSRVFLHHLMRAIAVSLLWDLV